MKTLSIAEFEALVARNDWLREQDHEVVGSPGREDWDTDEDGDEIRIEIPHSYGFASKLSRLGEIEIVYTEGFSFDNFDSTSLDTSTEGMDKVWSITGVTVTDEDGDVMSDGQLADYLPDDFKDIDYSVLEIDKVIDIDVTEDSDMETFTLEIDGAPSIRFTGEKVASAASSANNASGSYSQQTGRWTELALYKTQGGKYICHQIGRTRWQGERDRFSGKVCETLEEAKEFFGHRWLAKELYSEAGIDDVVEVA